jgi:UDP-N-acetylmuramyl pentapeptide synthase
MSMMTLRKAHLAARRPLVGDPPSSCSACTPTRAACAGRPVRRAARRAIRCHDFLAQAKSAGAVAVLAERGLGAAGLPGLEVADSGPR